MESRRIIRRAVEPEQVDFPHAAQIFAVKREAILADGSRREEIAYCITSLLPSEADETRLASLIRGHWGIENGLHYRRDFTFDEDRCRIRNPNAAHVMASLRAIPIAVFALGIGPKRRRKPPPSMPSMTRYFAHRPASAVHFVCKDQHDNNLSRTE
ncbi:MAG: transposase [Hyphomicrobiaceae bacterium]|nr:transposase [Hyphomicrobiaceae bacterium]